MFKMDMMAQNATRFKLFAACVYELILLLALWMLCTWIFVRFFGDATGGYRRFGLQFFLWLTTGVYFVWCWCKTGQTLAAKTWKIKLINQQNAILSTKQALIRYVMVTLSLLACGAGFVWAVIDKDGLFLHDRMLKTRFIQVV